MFSLRQSEQSTSCAGVTALIALLFAFSLSLSLAASPAEVFGSVKITWDPNPEHDVIGYRVHYGSESGTYTDVMDVGPATAFEITGLIDGQIRFCSVTAYNIYEIDSDFAEELQVVYTAPVSHPSIGDEKFRIEGMTFGADHLVTFEVAGKIGNTVEVWASPDLADWTLIDTLTEISGPITIVDPAAARQARRFYRLGTPK